MPASLAASARGKPSSAPAIACRRAAAARSFSRRASRRSSSAGRSVRIVSARPPICVLPQPGWTQPESLRPASTQITSESENSRVGISNIVSIPAVVSQDEKIAQRFDALNAQLSQLGNQVSNLATVIQAQAQLL